MNLSGNPQETTQATVNSQVASTLGTADSNVAQSVQALSQVHQARLALQTRIAAGVVTQFGANSAQAQAAQATVANTKLVVARIAVVRSQISIVTPQVPANGWVLYGHVFDANLNPVSAYTIFFVDDLNAYQAAYGFAFTAGDGSFQLSFQGSANATAVPQLFLEVVNDKAMPVYLSTTAFQPKSGSPTYQDITLPAGEPILGDPPNEIRAIAMPDTANAPQAAAQSKTKKS